MFSCSIIAEQLRNAFQDLNISYEHSYVDEFWYLAPVLTSDYCDNKYVENS